MHSPLREKLASGIVWSGAGKVLSSLSTFILTFILARALTPSDYGQYTIALTTIVIIAGVGTLGMDQIVIRFVSMCVVGTDAAAMKRVIWRCLRIVVVATVIACVIFLLFGTHFYTVVLNAPDMARYLVLLAAWIFFATLQRQLAETYRGLNDVKHATLFGGVRSSGILSSLVVCAATLLLWITGKLTLYSALLAMFGASIIVVGVASLSLWRHLAGVDGLAVKDASLPDFGIASSLREGWPLWLATLLGTLNAAGSVWLAGALDTTAHVALLGVGQRFVALLVAPMIALNAVLPPLIARLHSSNDMRRLERLVRSSTGILLLPSLVLFGLLVVVGRPLLVHVFGAYYEAAYPILLLLCFGQIVNIGTGAWQIVLPMTGHRREVLVGSVIALATQFLLGVVLGLSFGVLGVAIGFCASSIVSNVFGTFLARRKLHFWTIATFDKRALQDIRQIAVMRLRKHVCVAK